jgi:hypothetical protein
MGKRAILAIVAGFGVIGLLSLGMLSAMLSVHGSDGRSGWDVALGRPATPITPKVLPEQARKRSMARLTVTGPTNPRGCPTILPGETARFSVTALNGMESDPNTRVIAVYKNGDYQDAIALYSPFPANATYDFTAGTSNFTVRFRTEDEYLGAGEYSYEDHDFTVTVDTTTQPSFSSFLQDVDDCDPLTYTARITVNRADSWSYRLLDSGGQEVAGGTPNSPDTSGCSFQAVVSGITGAAQIEITATNANGSTTQAFTLTAPAEPSVSLSAEPFSIAAGNDATLSWSATGAVSVEIDNGVGVVWSGGFNDTPSGTETVSPTTNTTYTATATGACGDTATAQVTVYVQGIPIPGMASITWVAQEGIGSRKTARFTEPAVFNWLAIDPSRTPRTARASARAAAFEDVRANTTARVSARAEVRGNRTARVSARATSRKSLEVRVLARARVLYPDRYHIKARNVSSGVVSEWGVIDADTSPLTLTDVSIASGTYSAWIEREGVFWKDARVGSEFTVVIGATPVVYTLPTAENLAASIAGSVTTLTWDSSSDITDDGMTWGLWFNATSPVTITGEPTYRFMANIGQTEYEYTFEQTASEYVSVAAISTSGTRGVAAELYLPWSTTAPTSPSNQTAAV